MPFFRKVCDLLFGFSAAEKSSVPPADTGCERPSVGVVGYYCDQDSGGLVSTAPNHEGKVKYYDVVRPTPRDGWPAFVDVHRVYCFDFYNFEPDPSELETIFASLPGYRRVCGGRRRDERWTWFGESMSNPPCLSAVSDWNGLTVVGFLREADWHAWDAAFQDRASHLPRPAQMGPI